MPRPKGTTKTGGRQKGTPNKTTNDMRKWLKSFLDQNQEQIEKDFKALEPRERIQAFERLLQYTLPKMQTLGANIELDTLSEDSLNTIIENLTESILKE